MLQIPACSRLPSGRGHQLGVDVRMTRDRDYSNRPIIARRTRKLFYSIYVLLQPIIARITLIVSQMRVDANSMLASYGNVLRKMRSGGISRELQLVQVV